MEGHEEVVTLPAKYTQNSTIEHIDLSKIKVDRSYQRDVSNPLVDAIAENWSEYASELLLVSNRGQRKDSEVDGGYFIVNGQHRMSAARKLGLTHLDARIIDLRKEEDPGRIEADLRELTNVRRSDRPYERYKARLRAGKPEAVAISAILEKFDTEANYTPNPDQGINAISTVSFLYNVDDGALLRETLEVVRDAWGHVGGKHATANILKAIAWFIDRHAGETSRTRLVERLKEHGAGSIERRGRIVQSTMSGALWMNTYRAIVEVYNEKLTEKSRLGWNTRGASAWQRKGGTWGS